MFRFHNTSCIAYSSYASRALVVARDRLVVQLGSATSAGGAAAQGLQADGSPSTAVPAQEPAGFSRVQAATILLAVGTAQQVGAILSTERELVLAKFELPSVASVGALFQQRRLPPVHKFVAVGGEGMAFQRRFKAACTLVGWSDMEALPTALDDDSLAALEAISEADRVTLPWAVRWPPFSTHRPTHTKVVARDGCLCKGTGRFGGACAVGAGVGLHVVRPGPTRGEIQGAMTGVGAAGEGPPSSVVVYGRLLQVQPTGPRRQGMP
ncbi:unnamed protein product [Lampetra planeri]